MLPRVFFCRMGKRLLQVVEAVVDRGLNGTAAQVVLMLGNAGQWQMGVTFSATALMLINKGFLGLVAATLIQEARAHMRRMGHMVAMASGGRVDKVVQTVGIFLCQVVEVAAAHLAVAVGLS